MKKIVIDARMYGPAHTGIGRYVANLIRELKNTPLAKKTAITLLVSQSEKKAISKELGSDFSCFPVSAPHYSFKEQIELPQVLKKLAPDLVHFPHFNVPAMWRGRCVITIHDLIKHFYRGSKTTTKNPFAYWPKYGLYRLLVLQAVKRAGAIITPTRWWQDKIIDYFRLDKNKVFFTHEAVDPSFLDEDEPVRPDLILKKHHLYDKKFIVYTGNLYPHKNIDRLVKALVSSDNQNLTLAIANKPSVFSQRLKKLTATLKGGNRIRFLGFVPDEELKILYRQAVCFIQPSLMEGFGLTGLEAMSCWCPVLSSNESCLPEVYQNSVLYFDPRSIKDIADKISLISRDGKLRKQLIKLGRQQVAKYSWKKTAQQTAEVYEKVLGERP